MAINLGADDNGGFGNAFQRQFKRSIGVGGEPSMIEPKRVTQDNGPNPLRREWNGWQEQGDQMEGGPFGGAGGPMPIPEGGPNWRGNPKGVGMNMPNGKGPGGWFNPPDDIVSAGGPMPIPDGGPNWRGTTGGFDPVGGNGLGGPQPTDIPNGSGAGGPMPIPWPAGSSPVPGNPNAYYMQNHPNNPNSKYAQWKASQQQAQPVPGNTGIVPPHRQDGNGGRILGGPFGPPHPQGGPQIPQQPGGFNFADRMQGLPQNGWNWGELGNIRNRRF